MATRPLTDRFAAVTQALPAPTILSTAGTDSVPKARAAIAELIATLVAGGMLPEG